MFEAEVDDWWAEVPPDLAPPPEEEVFDPRTGLAWSRPELGWLFGTMRERLEWVCAQPPGAVTAAALEAIGREPMSGAERVLYAKAWDRQASHVAAGLAAAEVDATVAEVDATVGDGSGPGAGDPRVVGIEQEVLDRELGLMLRRSDPAMSAELGFARRLRSVFPRAWGLLAGGEISLAHARVLDDCTALLAPELARWVDATLAERACRLTPASFRRALRRAVARLLPDPDTRHGKARRQAGVRLFPEPDGMTTLSVLLPATDGVAALASLNAAADRLRVPGEERTHGQRQVTALLAALLGAPDTPTATPTGGTPTGGTGGPAGGPAGGGRVRARRRTEVQVSIDWASLLGLREQPAELAGYGPLPASAVRALLGEPGTVLRRLVHDPLTGVLVDYGRARYTPDAHLLGLVRARDLTCRFPGCTRNAIWCDLEHAQPFAAGGATSCANCGLACRTHHRLKTHHRFRYTRPDPATGETVWTTPLGFTYRQHPATYRDGPHPGDTVRQREPAPG